MWRRMGAGALVGFCAHWVRPWLVRYTPQRRGMFPLACYFVGGVVVIGVAGLVFGRRSAGQTAVAFALVGSGVGVGWIVEWLTLENRKVG